MWPRAIYQHAEPDGDGAGGGSGSLFDVEGDPPADPPADDAPPADPPADPPAGDDPSADEPTWRWSEDVAGEGDRPDWLDPKYDSVQAQAQALQGLNEQIGRAGRYFGAPDEYAVPEIPEGLDGEINADDPLLTQFSELAAKVGLSQEGYNEIAGLYFNDLAEAHAEAMEAATAIAKEIPQFATRRGDLDKALTAALSADAAKAMMDGCTSRVQFEALEALVKTETRLPGAPAVTGQKTAEELSAMRYEKYPEGHRLEGKLKYDHDPAHRQAVMDEYERVHPGEDVQIVGPS